MQNPVPQIYIGEQTAVQYLGEQIYIGAISETAVRYIETRDTFK